jgi:serine/threonine protein kinase
MKKIGKYKICGFLGKGGMGKVYKIEYPVTGKIAALKHLDPNPLLVDLIGMEKIEKLFTSEAVTMAKLRHPNIVEIWDYDRFEGKLYYIMDFYCNNLGTMIGESYETERSSRIISIDKAFHYTGQTLSGLSCLHYNGMIHRDIKPFNILVTDFDDVKICDFGLSKLRGEIFEGHNSLKIGSPYYTAPEQEKDPDHVDFNTDLYSVGVMFYRMITGRLPEMKREKASYVNLDLSDEFDDFLSKALSKNPSERYFTADDMIKDLQKLHAVWLENKEKICSVPEDFFDDEQTKIMKTDIRSTPKKISKNAAEKNFSLTELMMPEIYLKNNFQKKENNLIYDNVTGLLWQKSGTKYPVNWNQAKTYVEKLNEEKLGGYSNWRLPTTEELITLLYETPEGTGYCIEPVFDTDQKWLWSSDKCTFLSAWYISLDLGFVSYNDLSSFYHVKGVCKIDN